MKEMEMDIPFRVGFGYDSHIFENGKVLRLGGVEIPGESGLKAHSDGDVVIHALIDALFGAAAMGDIGSHFPDTDAKWKGADSAFLLSSAVSELDSAGWKVGNVDITVICERPRIRPYADAMRKRLADLLGVDAGAVSLKGKTNEKMDDVGAGLGIEVHAVAMLVNLRAFRSV